MVRSKCGVVRVCLVLVLVAVAVPVFFLPFVLAGAAPKAEVMASVKLLFLLYNLFASLSLVAVWTNVFLLFSRSAAK